MSNFGSYQESINIIKKLLHAYTVEVENNVYAIAGFLDKKKALEFAIALIEAEEKREIEIFEKFTFEQLKIEKEM